MESRLALDTHVIIWLYTRDLKKLSTRALELIQGKSLVISPIILMELNLLFELGRVDEPSKLVYENLKATLPIDILQTDFLDVVNSSLELTWTRDPFDRLIVASANAAGIPLLTKDKRILDNFELAVW